jgi:uncharacterized protein (TIGR02145 family)
LYLAVTNPITGRTWLNNNLGAQYADTNSNSFKPTQQATSSTDHKAYGSLFQWGRKADGHELINWPNGPKSGVTTTRNNTPTNTLFITSKNHDPYDWREKPNNNLWANESSENNVCPVGYRLPPAGKDGENKEWEVEANSWHTDYAHRGTTSAHALASTLKLSMPGSRLYTNGKLTEVGTYGGYWSANIGANIGGGDRFARYMRIKRDKVEDQEYSRATGHSVRCIKD